LSVDRACRCEAIADDSAARDVMQIINPLGIGTIASYTLSNTGAKEFPLIENGRAKPTRH
jgi:hypothetical protein